AVEICECHFFGLIKTCNVHGKSIRGLNVAVYVWNAQCRSNVPSGHRHRKGFAELKRIRSIESEFVWFYGLRYRVVKVLSEFNFAQRKITQTGCKSTSFVNSVKVIKLPE